MLKLKKIIIIGGAVLLTFGYSSVAGNDMLKESNEKQNKYVSYELHEKEFKMIHRKKIVEKVSRGTATPKIKSTPIPTIESTPEKKEVKRIVTTPVPDSNEISGGNIFKVTAYDLSYASCQKYPSDKYYGITRSGFSLKGHSRISAMVVACDPNVIPLGAKIEVKFTNPNYQKFSGIYVSKDTGGGVNGRHIDIFMGDYGISESSTVKNFGVTRAYVRILK